MRNGWGKIQDGDSDLGGPTASILGTDGRQAKRRRGYLGTGISLCFYQKFWCHSIVSRNIGRFFVTSLLCDHVQQSRRSRNMVQVLIHPCHLFWMPWHSLRKFTIKHYSRSLRLKPSTKAISMLDHLEVPKMGMFPKMGPQIIPDLTILVLKILVIRGSPSWRNPHLKPPTPPTPPTPTTGWFCSCQNW